MLVASPTSTDVVGQTIRDPNIFIPGFVIQPTLPPAPTPTPTPVATARPAPAGPVVTPTPPAMQTPPPTTAPTTAPTIRPTAPPTTPPTTVPTAPPTAPPTTAPTAAPVTGTAAPGATVTVAGVTVVNNTPGTISVTVQGNQATITGNSPISVAGATCRPGANANQVICTVAPGARLTVSVAGVQRAPAAAPAVAPVARAVGVAPAQRAPAQAPAALPRTGTGFQADSGLTMGLLTLWAVLTLTGVSGLAFAVRRTRR